VGTTLDFGGDWLHGSNGNPLSDFLADKHTLPRFHGTVHATILSG